MYKPLKYVDYQSFPGCKVSRRTSCSTKNDVDSSRYGTCRDKCGIRCRQYDDASCPRGYGGCSFTAANKRDDSFRRYSLSRRSSTPKQAPRYHELARPRNSQCGPNCEYSRCAANDPCYAQPFYARYERHTRRRVARKSGEFPSPSLLRNTSSRMAQIKGLSQRAGGNMTMGLRYLPEAQDPRNLDVLPNCILRCDDLDRAECSDKGPGKGADRSSGASMEGVSTRGPYDSGLKSLATKTVLSNTEEACYRAEVHEIPTHEKPEVPLHGHEAPSQPAHEGNPLYSQTSTPTSSTSRRETTPRRMHPQRQKWLPEHQSQKPPPPSPTPPQLESPQHSSQASSPLTLTSEYESDATGTTNSDSHSPTPTACLCSLCGKSENASTMTTGVYKNNNNPLYDLASPLQSPARASESVATMPGSGFGLGPLVRVRNLALEVIVLLALGGLVTLALMSFAESVFGAYLARICGCLSGSGKNVGVGPQLMADGLKSGVVNWVTCPMDDCRAKLTRVR